MSRFLFAPMPFTGHVNPGLPIARELVARGHDVRWYSTPRFRRAIEDIGARYVPFYYAMPLDEERLDEMFLRRPKSGGIAQLRWDIKNIFVDFWPGALRDLANEIEREPADVVVGDSAAAAPEALHARYDIAWAVYGISVLTMSSRDTAPFGLAMMPDTTPMGRLRNRVLTKLVDRVIFGAANKHNATLRRRLNLPPLGKSIMDFTRDADLYLQGSVAAFEYPRTDMPANVQFIGAPMPQVPENWTPPVWWSELDRHRVVLVTQGTINNDYDQLIRPAIRALSDQGVLVIVTTGSKPPSAIGIDPLPCNVIAERFVPYAALMPKVDLLVTNGGYGSIQMALAQGVPVVAIGKTEEKPEIANRVEWSGVGVGVKALVPTETQIRDAVQRVLNDVTYKARANAMRYEMADVDAAVRGAELLERLAGTESAACECCA
ncbi:MAG: glycosyl transferase [Acidobacteria bacterium]|nr:MAG: glycosyl transferase [Acidobacteriota bacterium]